MRAAVREAESALGPITAVVHGAGVNVPALLGSLDEAAFLQTLAPKLQGARQHPRGGRGGPAQAAGDLRLDHRPDGLARRGRLWRRQRMAGATDRAVPAGASGLSLPGPGVVGLVGRRHGGSAGARRGPGAARGSRRFRPTRACRNFRRLVASPAPAVSLVVAGRFGDPPGSARSRRSDLPLLRFLEQPLVDYPGVELVVEATLATESDPYLDDHVFQGERLFPAVMGLEAMAQAAMAVLRMSEAAGLRGPAVRPPIVVPRRPVDDDPPRRAGAGAGPRRCGPPQRRRRPSSSIISARLAGSEPRARSPRRIEPDTSLTGRRVARGTDRSRGGTLRSTPVPGRPIPTTEAAIGGYGRPSAWPRSPAPTGGVVPSLLPAELVLGDPAARDAAIHAVQACIPQATILPIGVDRLIPGVCRPRPALIS